MTAPERLILAVVLAVSGLVMPAGAEEPGLGKQVFEIRCAPCHGDNGGGDGPAAAAIVPKPRNFQDPEFWRARSAPQLKLVVQKGRPGTLMAPFEGVLSDAEIDAVVGYLVATFKPKR
jgi:high-affinity iron transporter